MITMLMTAATAADRRKEQLKQEQKHADKQRAVEVPLRNSGILRWYHVCDALARL